MGTIRIAAEQRSRHHYSQATALVDSPPSHHRGGGTGRSAGNGIYLDHAAAAESRAAHGPTAKGNRSPPNSRAASPDGAGAHPGGARPARRTGHWAVRGRHFEHSREKSRDRLGRKRALFAAAY